MISRRLNISDQPAVLSFIVARQNPDQRAPLQLQLHLPTNWSESECVENGTYYEYALEERICIQ